MKNWDSESRGLDLHIYQTITFVSCLVQKLLGFLCGTLSRSHQVSWCIWLSRPPNTRKVGSSILSEINEISFCSSLKQYATSAWEDVRQKCRVGAAVVRVMSTQWCCECVCVSCMPCTRVDEDWTKGEARASHARQAETKTISVHQRECVCILHKKRRFSIDTDLD